MSDSNGAQLALPLETFEDDKQLEFFDKRTGDIILRRVTVSPERDTQNPCQSTSDEPQNH